MLAPRAPGLISRAAMALALVAGLVASYEFKSDTKFFARSSLFNPQKHKLNCSDWPVVLTEEHKTGFREVLKHIHKTLTGNSVPYALAYGAALGFYRLGKMMPWDGGEQTVVPQNLFPMLCCAFYLCESQAYNRL